MPVDPSAAAIPGLPQIGRSLDPAEHHLDPSAHALAGGVARMAHRASVPNQATPLASLVTRPSTARCRVTRRAGKAAMKPATS